MSDTKVHKISADSLLEQFVDCYIFREVGADGTTVRKSVPPNHVTSLDLFMGNPFSTIDLETKAEIPYKTAAIRGCRTNSKYAIEYNNTFSVFSVKFKPTGLYSLLGIEMHKLTDTDIDCSAIKLPFDIQSLYKKIAHTSEISERVNIIESVLVDVLTKEKNKSRLSSFFPNSNNFEDLPIYLSQRQQQRLFRSEVGLSPKIYSSLKRFSNLLRARKQNETLSWTSLAHDHGYYDQAHLIKEFYAFLSMAPTLFSIEAFAL
ncbi:MAG TPA: helix-turn-helix domain-containing protein [Niabella sp.]|nr:helix-turn-helix domain-containing protein [Niabella sp.]HOZ96772.1 helix-turn-helix domain-containing protein [Niabella sp.]HQW14751.1 helix-turn-helix domain-containing protein [Niabella sp.]HQX19997.1 helix-turn-helix domain-containing protein [Niabella sp.]HQX40617.1 helix-turn-helix domain-containing protein [Niabella sp.]